jgi:hypothetical protein
LNELKRRSGQDFGEDVAAWEAWVNTAPEWEEPDDGETA